MENNMLEALVEAKKALYEFSEVPVGCVFLLKNQKIIARGHNLVNTTKNATRHAEFVCIDQVLEYCKTNNLKPDEIFPQITVVVTVEPCIMCASALFELNVDQVVFGANNDRFGGTTVVDVSQIIPNKTKIQGGLMEDAAMNLLKDFYKCQNPSAPIPKVKVK